GAIVGGLVQLFVGLPLAIVIIVWAQRRVYNWLVRLAEKIPGVDVKEFDVEKELKNGNMAMAAILFGTFLAISFVLSQGIAFLSEPISSAITSLLR
ncbi:MAG: DUF350 domain-containing protein, partial [Aigarchaeota archaeon]|nr:DUF350 domain-containing protein [Candidatus Calditenuaceae archaeon]